MKSSSRWPAALLAIALLLAARSAGAQGFQSIYTRDGIDVIAVGDNGETYRSLIGGDVWSERVIGSPALTLRAVTGRGLAMLIASDGGVIWTSGDAGGNWSSTLVSLSPNLRGAAMATDSTWVVVGDGGTIVRTTDAGASWLHPVSGTAEDLYAVRFVDTQKGWAVGGHGTVLATADGGATWSPMNLATPNTLLSVDQKGSNVWVVGTDGTALRSTNGGTTFSPVDLQLDARADVRCVNMVTPDSLWLTGGGGFMRTTSDDGATWFWPQHKMHAPISCLITYGNLVLATNSKNRIVMNSSDHGNFWRLPNGATFSRSWGASPRFPFGGQVRGNSFALNPVYKSTLYCALGVNVLRSRDDGDSWQIASTFPAGYNKVNAFVVSAKDSNLWLAAISGGTVVDRLYRSIDGGANWSISLTHDFGEYGVPLAADPDHPDSVYFGGEANPTGSPGTPLYRSFDFGASWDSVNTALFRSPCDMVVVPDTTGMIIVGDGVTGVGFGQLLKSVDGGQSFALKDSTASSEIPALATTRLRPGTIFSTNWSTGGVQRSTNYGETWPQVDASAQAWGVDIAKDDPNVVVFGLYSSPFNAFISLDGGTTFTSIPAASGNNYSFYLRDRATMLAEQSSGIWKLQPVYNYVPQNQTQALQLLSPVGGEAWVAGSLHNISWSSAAIAEVRIEYRRSEGEPWQFVANMGGYYGSYGWHLPQDATSHAKIRVYDLWDSVPLDSSHTDFTILAPRISVSPATLDFGAQGTGGATVLPLTLKNPGTSTLTVSLIKVATTVYAVGRTSITLAAGAQDTVGIWFLPGSAGTFRDSVSITSNDPTDPLVRVPLVGQAGTSTLTLTAPNGGETWSAGTVQNITWASAFVPTIDLSYRVAPDSAWIAIASGLPATPASYPWTIPFRSSDSAAVRVVGGAGSPFDLSNALLALRAQKFAATPAPLHLPDAQVGYSVGDPLWISNPGDAPLTVSGIASGNPEFWAGRTNLVIPGGATDSVGVFYAPVAAGDDSTTLTITTNEPGSPHLIKALARGVVSLAAGAEGPLVFALGQNLPNPFSVATLIQYTLPRDADVTLDVFDLRGDRVARLVNAHLAAGRHESHFGVGAHGAGGAGSGSAPAGVYFYRLRAGSQSATRKMLFVR